jgi:hypothetical protein
MAACSVAPYNNTIAVESLDLLASKQLAATRDETGEKYGLAVAPEKVIRAYVNDIRC